MPRQTLVMKFGGTSVGSADALVKATQIVKDARAEYPRATDSGFGEFSESPDFFGLNRSQARN